MDKNIEDLKHIRSMMERSSKFLSISGISGISAGIFALAGAFIAHCMLEGQFTITSSLKYDLYLLAIAVLLGASISGFYFSLRKAKKEGIKFWGPGTKQILQDFFVPMIVGGLFCIIQIYHNMSYFVAPSMLIFYGLALTAVGSRTYKEIKLLGVCEITLGLLSAIFISKGLLFWTIGFGVLHVVAGILLYCKYDSKSNQAITR